MKGSTLKPKLNLIGAFKAFQQLQNPTEEKVEELRIEFLETCFAWLEIYGQKGRRLDSQIVTNIRSDFALNQDIKLMLIRDIVTESLVWLIPIRHTFALTDKLPYRHGIAGFRLDEGGLRFSAVAGEIMECLEFPSEEKEKRFSLIKRNILSQEHYIPYCGAVNGQGQLTGCSMPRTGFNGSQFECPHCAFQTKFSDHFIITYKTRWGL